MKKLEKYELFVYRLMNYVLPMIYKNLHKVFPIIRCLQVIRRLRCLGSRYFYDIL